MLLQAVRDLHGSDVVEALDALCFFCRDDARSWLGLFTGIWLEPDQVIYKALEAEGVEKFRSKRAKD